MEVGKSTRWSDDEVKCLLSLWGDETMQTELQDHYHNKFLFEDISTNMGRQGFKRSWLDCRQKIKNLKYKYRSVKDHNNKSGNSCETFLFYDKMEGILGDRPSFRPPELLDTTRVDDVPSSVDSEEPEFENSNSTGKGKRNLF
uniref:Zinc finger and SCAN domain-containing protein 29-like n=1 Tax=Oryzias latipes TaxID=8090 RepID=A0A286P9V8_ORYLA|nr:zinc finger and SCAN domain-containing protein 29-like [Oryzias latipes]